MIKRAPSPLSPFQEKQRQDEIAFRLREAREGLGLTQTEFATQVGFTRDRLASYEEERAPLRCDLALKACRYFFISEFWLAFGSVNEDALKAGNFSRFSEDLDARLTMALAVAPIGGSFPFGATFYECFDPHLRGEYNNQSRLFGGFPAVIPLPTDGPKYLQQAALCMMQFWKRDLSEADFGAMMVDVFRDGNRRHQKKLDLARETKS